MVNCAQNESPKENGNIAGKDVKEKVLEPINQCSPIKKIEYCNELSDHEECSDAPLEGVRQRVPRIDPFSSPEEKELTKVGLKITGLLYRGRRYPNSIEYRKVTHNYQNSRK